MEMRVSNLVLDVVAERDSQRHQVVHQLVIWHLLHTTNSKSRQRRVQDNELEM